MIANIKNLEIRKNRDSGADQRMLSCEMTSPDDVQSVELSNTSGEDNNPLNDDVVLVLSITDAYKIGLLIDDGVSPDSSIERGEKLIYSRDSSNSVMAKIAFKKDGQIIMNGGTDYAVAFGQLKVAFDQLKLELNSALSALSLPLSSADIDPAKVEKVRL